MLAWGEADQRRTLKLLGRIRKREVLLVSRCGWCGKWDSPRDFILAHATNAQVSHSMCPTCAKKWAEDPTFRGVGPKDAA
jgi:hypothetical protein